MRSLLIIGFAATFICTEPSSSQTLFPCQSDQQDIATEALETAQQMLQFTIEGHDNDSLNFGIKANLWFGAKNAGDASQLRDTYERALEFSKDMKFLCALDSTFDAIAAVNQSAPVPFIMLGEEFFDLEEQGFNSRPGVLVHELSHGLLVSGTNSQSEEVYSQEAVLELAKQDPEKAMSNADNYQYFVEAFYFSLDPSN